MKNLLIALRLFLVMTVLTGIAYPLLVTGIGQVAFRSQANGSLIEKDGKVLGSRLIGQAFDDPKYFWGRPSATAPYPYNASASSGANFGPTNAALKETLQGRIDALKAADPTNTQPVPTELVTTSASGLDPHISPAAATYQAERVARVRGIPLEQVRKLITTHTQGRSFGVLGEPVVNVLELNLALEGRR